MVWIGFTGYARSGKSTAAGLIVQRYPKFKRYALGHVIKESADPVLKAYLGISAFTEDPDEKRIIRDFLVHHGYQWYSVLFERYKKSVLHEPYLVNERIFRPVEATWWRGQGGYIFEVTTPGLEPAEPKEAEELELLRHLGLIDGVLYNDGTLEGLYRELERKVFPLIEERYVGAVLDSPL